MFFDDLILVKTLAHKYEARGPFVECGGIPDPTIADYSRTIEAMAKLKTDSWGDVPPESIRPEAIRDAQMCRYIHIHRPLSFLDENYVCEDPATGGLPIEQLAAKYDPDDGTGIGTAILLSVLEHVADPFEAIDRLRDAMQVGGLAIVSTPWAFPTHYGPEDNWRISESGLRHIFSPPAGTGEPARWQILESGPRLNIPAEAGILDGDGRAQIVQSAFICARAV